MDRNTPNLSPELEWMLSSTQAPEAMIRETVAREYGAALYRLALTLLNDPNAALQAVQETLEILPANRHRYAGQTGVGNWLYSLTIQICRRYRWAKTLGLDSKIRQPMPGRQFTVRWQGPARRETEVDRQVWQAVDRLREGYRLALLLSTVHRMPVDEIARVAGSSESAVLKRLRSARLTLYRRLRGRLCQLQVNQKKRWFGQAGLAHRRARDLAQRKLAAEALDAQETAFLDAHLHNCPSCLAFAVEMAELETLLARSLPARSSPYMRTTPGTETFLIWDGDSPARRGKKRFPFSGLQLVGTGLLIASVLVTGRVTNRIFPISAAAPLVQTVKVTRVVRVPVTQVVSPTPAPAPAPLSESSTQEEIQQRMIESGSLWRSIWVDATLFSYGPFGYIGPPQVYRNQVWIEQPARSMVLSGPQSSDPENIVFMLYDNMYEMDLKTGLTFYYQAGELVNQRLYGPAPAFSDLNGYNPRPLVEGAFVQHLLSPQALAQEVRSMRVLGSETVLGRQAVVVDVTVSEQMPKRLWVGSEFGIDESGNRYLLWVDSITGVLLRQQHFDPAYPWKVVDEAIFNAISFDANFPEQSYSSYFFSPERFIWENEWVPAQASLSASQPPQSGGFSWENSSMGSQVTPEPLPTDVLQGVDFSHSTLTFQWDVQGGPMTRKESAEPYSPGNTASLFIGRYFLGRTEMGNPWYLVCERSPDGKKIVYNEGSADPFLAVNDLRWLSLDKPEFSHYLLPQKSLAGSDSAFSPDSRSIAFWGCGGSEGNCGIYIYNVETLKTRKLIKSESAAYFTWSPDGNYLAMIRFDPSPRNQKVVPRVTVLGVRYGDIVYQQEIDLQSKIIPEDSPTQDWGVEFPPLRTGLEGCIAPPGR